MKKILLVEDDPYLVDIYTTKLEREKFEVDVARTGEGAFELMKKNKFDLVILDIMLPDMSGWEILEEMRKNRKTKKNKVIIFSNVDPDNKKMALNLGVEKYLVKINYTPNEVINQIKKILS